MRIIGNPQSLYESRLGVRIIYAIFWHIDEWQAIFKHVLIDVSGYRKRIQMYSFRIWFISAVLNGSELLKSFLCGR